MASLKGTNDISGKEYLSMQDMLLEVSDTIEVKSLSVLKELLVKVNYKVNIIEQGQIPISDISMFVKFLERFVPTDDVTISLVENKVVIERENPKKTARMITTSAENVVASQGTATLSKHTKNANGFWSTEKYSYNLKIDFDAEEMQNVIGDGDLIKQRVYPFVVKQGKFNVPLTSKEVGDLDTEILTSVIASDPNNIGPLNTRTAYAAGLDNLFSALQGKVSLYLVDGGFYPFVLEQHSEKFDFMALLAPRVEDEV
jgi:hypothetical protein